jgi:ADP-ribose pyrophosphatase YjhB (NUDIX family)
MVMPTPRFCSSCGGPLTERMIAAEHRLRLVCTGCGAIAYRSPQVLVSALVAAGSRVLLGRRAEPPAAGRWAPPGGFMECGETLEQAAARETLEETGVRIDPRELRLYAVSTLPQISEVYVGFRVALAEEQPVNVGSECLEAGFFAEADIPWEQLAYPDIGGYLRRFFREHQRNDYAIHFGHLGATEMLRHSYKIREVEEARMTRPGDGGAWRKAE